VQGIVMSKVALTRSVWDSFFGGGTGAAGGGKG
jgi:hypothetical protein